MQQDDDFNEIKEMMEMLGEVTKQMQNLPNPLNNFPGVNPNLGNLKNQLTELQKQTQTYQQINQNQYNHIVISFINKSTNSDPVFTKDGDSGFDLRANLSENVILKPLTMEFIPTGLFFEVPNGFEIQVRSRSGIARDYQVFVLNQPGTVDSGYRGEVSVMLFNLGKNDLIIKHGDRIAQGVVCPVYGSGKLGFIKTDKLSDSKRGSSGFGDSGIQ